MEPSNRVQQSFVGYPLTPSLASCNLLLHLDEFMIGEQTRTTTSACWQLQLISVVLSTCSLLTNPTAKCSDSGFVVVERSNIGDGLMVVKV